MNKMQQKLVVEHQLDVAKNQITKMRSGKDVPLEVSGALLSLHTALLALSNIVSDQATQPEAPRFGKPVL